MGGEADQLEGKAKEIGGKLTGDKQQEAEGQTQNALGGVEKAADDAGDRAKGVADGIEQKI